jgi:iron(III) transport system ATP-binding protein
MSDSPGAAALTCSGLAKAYGRHPVLTDVDLTVPDGTITAILGASGSGKTTLLRLIVGFIAPDRGVVSISGRTVAEAGGVHLAPDKRAVGYVAQEGALFPHETVAGNIAFGLARGTRRHGARVAEMLDLVGLGRDYADRRPHQLSGGEQRRVSLARALAPRPRLVLLDEPFSGLDAALRAETRDAVLQALAAEGTTAVLVTHDQAEALSTGREVAVLREGRLVQTAPPAVLYREPVDLDVARFVGDAVVLPGVVRSGAVECALGSLTPRTATADGEVLVMIRPEQIRAAPGDVAEVVEQRYLGPDTMVRLALRDGQRTTILMRTFDQQVAALGEVVGIAVVGPVAVYPTR